MGVKLVTRDLPHEYTKIAETIGYSISHVWRVMNGKAEPSMKMLEKLALYRGVGLEVMNEELKRIRRREKRNG
jgi:transcriptional regulator with XRE-family HTH domain